MCLKLVILIVLCVLVVEIFALDEVNLTSDDDIDMHSYLQQKENVDPHIKRYKIEEEFATYWKDQAQRDLRAHLARKHITGKAKNIILFLGDGMSISTITASRIYLGQSNTNGPGEEAKLSFEKLPYTGFSKTYCVNRQVADSACSATAYLCGVKTNDGTIGVTASVKLKDCKAMQNPDNHVDSIARWSQLEGKRTGFVTTTRVTHASPAGLYSHTADRSWESDTDVNKAGFDPKYCPDIASQLIHGVTGSNLNVILGGGRKEFIPKQERDEEGHRGARSDGSNLIKEWKKFKSSSSHEYVYNRTGLLNIPTNTTYVLGLFDRSHTKYNVERDPSKKPSLSEMTKTAIQFLSQDEKGFFLFVEGGRIDHAHHGARAHKALNETIELHKAVQAALDMTSDNDTLIILTSDHGHTMTLNGYPSRGNDVLGISGYAADGLPYTTISYANGPGYHKEKHGNRHNIDKDALGNYNYRFPGLVPKDIETHSGEDVGIFARGPWAHLFTGVMEQNVIPHIMAYASCVGDGITVCNERTLV